jgi:hypothetical protein
VGWETFGKTENGGIDSEPHSTEAFAAEREPGRDSLCGDAHASK